ncbi:hypothetical protein Hanom_Chr12g01142051 [Helianthus anomalus]
MGYTRHINDDNCSKANFSMPYKFLVHSVIHAMGHRKGGYDVVVDYIMCMATALVLNLPYSFTKMIFEHMKLNTTCEKFLQYPRFIQMNLDDKIKNLSKEESDELPLEHMTNGIVNRLQVFKKKGAPPEEGKKKRGKKSSTPKKVAESSSSKPEQQNKPVQRTLIDEPSDDEAQNDQNVETGEAENVENIEGGESSSSSSEIALTEIAPTTGDPRAKWKKKKDKAQKKRKNSDEEDTTYEPSGPEIQKISKGRMK